MSGRQVIVTTVFGAGASRLGETFTSFQKNPDTELHVFVYGESLPTSQLPGIHYHLVQPDPGFVSTRRDALFRRWTWPDQLDAEYALVVDGTDVICLRPLPHFSALLRGAAFAAATEWGGPVSLLGQGYTSCYLNAGVTFWHLPSSQKMRAAIVARGRQHYRGPFDDQTALNEVMQTQYFDQMVILPSQFNWRAQYRKNLRLWPRPWATWPRVDRLDGVYLYHNVHCLQEVTAALQSTPPAPKAALAELPKDNPSLGKTSLLLRRILHRLRST